MVLNRAKLLLCFTLLLSLIACEADVPPTPLSGDTETAISPNTPEASSSYPTFEETRAAEFEANIKDIDDFSRDMINLMLDSHNRWQTLQAEVRGQWSTDSSQILQHTILIRQPYLAQISGADYQATLGTDESAQQRIMHDLSLLPTSLGEIQSITVYPHPMVGMGLGFAGDYIFPVGFAQRVGRFELIAEEPILERQTWVVDWFDVMNGGEKRNRFWIDQQTGLILKSWEYGEGAITGEVEFLALVLDEPIPYEMPPLASWVVYEDADIGLALQYPPNWTVTERGNGLTLTAPQTAVVDAEPIPWTIWISERPKFADDALLFDVIVNEYHFPGVMEQFEETLTEETINGRTVYRSTIIPAQGGQVSVFFEDGDRFVEVTLRPFDAERPYENQAIFTQIFDTLLGTVTFLSAGG